MLLGDAVGSSSPAPGAAPAEGLPRRSSVPAGLHEAIWDAVQDRGGVVGASKAQSAAEARQRRASALSRSERLDALFGERGLDALGAGVSPRGSVASPARGPGRAPNLRRVSSQASVASPVQRFASQCSVCSVPARGAGPTLAGRPFCAPREDMGSLYLRLEAVKRNAERNKQELVANRAFMDEVHDLEELGRAARAHKRREAGLPEEEEEGEEEKEEAASWPAAKSTHQRADAMRENLLSNRRDLEWTRSSLDELLVFAGRKEGQVFDPVGFAKRSGLPPFALPPGGETSTPLRLDAMFSTLKGNESRLREHRELLDEVRATSERREGRQGSRRAASAGEVAALGQPRGSPLGSPGSTASGASWRAVGSLSSRLDAVADAARSNAMELRAFRGTIGEARHALRGSGAPAGRGAPPVERLFCAGRLRPARSTRPDRSKEIKTRVEVMTLNASKNFENLSCQRQALRRALAEKEAGAVEGEADRGGPRWGASMARPMWRSGGFGVKV